MSKIDKPLEPPESTKSLEDCKFISRDGICCNAKNYLRPHKCNGYCVEKVDQWLRKTYPDLGDEAVKKHVIRITEHQLNS